MVCIQESLSPQTPQQAGSTCWVRTASLPWNLQSRRRWHLVNKMSESASLCCSWVWLILETWNQVIALEHNFHWGGAGSGANMTSTVIGRESLILTPDQNPYSSSFKEIQLISSIRKVKSALFRTKPPSLRSHLCYALPVLSGESAQPEFGKHHGLLCSSTSSEETCPYPTRENHSLSFNSSSAPTYGWRW